MPPPPSLGARIDYAGYHGSVRYVGQVLNSQGLWLGIEWDDHARGKHNGVKDGVPYFQCLVPGAGSFIRPSAKVSLGTSFLQALSFKYIESLHGSGSQETVMLGSSNRSIQVEAVDLDKIRRKLSDLNRLREVSLENVSCSDHPGAILKTCPHIRGLDLSNSLIPTWDVVAQIASELPALERLALNRTRLSLPAEMDRMARAFLNLVELRLNRTMTSWSTMMTVISIMPHLQVVEMGHNQLSHLCTHDNRAGASIQTLNLDGNLCNDWVHLCECLGHGLYPTLQRLVLSSNGLASIPFPDKPTLQLVGIRHLALSFNCLESWHDIDALVSWCPNLESLMLGGNPLAIESENLLRPFAIAKIPSLKTLDGSTISLREREDCELFYISHVSRDSSKTPEELAREHPRWQELCLKHGQTGENQSNKATSGRLKDQVITLSIFLAPTGVDKSFSFETSEYIRLTAIPSMTLRTLRAKISRALKSRGGRAQVILWQRMQDDILAELDSSRDAQDLSWIGLEDGGSIVCAFQDEKRISTCIY